MLSCKRQCQCAEYCVKKQMNGSVNTFNKTLTSKCMHPRTLDLKHEKSRQPRGLLLIGSRIHWKITV